MATRNNHSLSLLLRGLLCLLMVAGIVAAVAPKERATAEPTRDVAGHACPAERDTAATFDAADSEDPTGGQLLAVGEETDPDEDQPDQPAPPPAAVAVGVTDGAPCTAHAFSTKPNPYRGHRPDYARAPPARG